MNDMNDVELRDDADDFEDAASTEFAARYGVTPL